jgi:hypothetical protein
MQRRTTFLLAAVTLVLIAAGVSVWCLWFPPRAEPLQQRLLGAWDGTGKVSSEFSFEIKPDPAHNIPGGKSSGTVTADCTVYAEFKPDGTYTWREQHRSGDAKSQMTFAVEVPKDGEQAHWKVVRADGSKLTIGIYLGEIIFDFQGEDVFTLDWPESAKASGHLTFRRPGAPER